MKKKQTVLIVTDEADSTQKIAREVESFLGGKKVLKRTASEFNPTEMLAADICFLGCEKQRPDSFAVLEKLLLHVNLAGRPCGLFTPGQEQAIDYLKKIVKDSELAIAPEPYMAGKSKDIKAWTNTVIQGG